MMTRKRPTETELADLRQRVVDECHVPTRHECLQLLAEIDELVKDLADANYWRGRHCSDAEAYGKRSQANHVRATAAEADRDDIKRKYESLCSKVAEERLQMFDEPLERQFEPSEKARIIAERGQLGFLLAEVDLFVRRRVYLLKKRAREAESLVEQLRSELVTLDQ